MVKKLFVFLILTSILTSIVTVNPMLETKRVDDTNNSEILKRYAKFQEDRHTKSFNFSVSADTLEQAISKLKTNDFHKNLLRYLYNKLNNKSLPYIKKNMFGSSSQISEEQFLQEFNEKVAIDYAPQIIKFDLASKITKAIETIKDKLLLQMYFDVLQNQYRSSFITDPNTQKGVFGSMIHQASPVQSINTLVFNNELKKLLEKKKGTEKVQSIIVIEESKPEEKNIIKPKEAIEKNRADEELKKEAVYNKRLEKAIKLIEKLKKQMKKDKMRLKKDKMRLKKENRIDAAEERAKDLEEMPSLLPFFEEERDEELDAILDQALDWYEEMEKEEKKN